jgi:hypothetical protein
MYAQVEKPKENKSRAVANSVAQKQSGTKPTFQFVDNRPEATAQRKIQSVANSSMKTAKVTQQQYSPLQRRRLDTYEQRKLDSERERLKGLVAGYKEKKDEITSKLTRIEQNLTDEDVTTTSFLREKSDEMVVRIDMFFENIANTAREASSSSAKLSDFTKALNRYELSGGRNVVTNLLGKVRRKYEEKPMPAERDKVTDVTDLDEKYFREYLARSKPAITVYRGDGRGVKADFLDSYSHQEVIAGGTPDITFAGVVEHTHSNTQKNGMVSTTTDPNQAKAWAIDANKYGVVYEFSLKNYIYVDNILERRRFKSRYAAQKEITTPGNISSGDIVSVSLYGQKEGLIKRV